MLPLDFAAFDPGYEESASERSSKAGCGKPANSVIM
jgi:hypothetical protein